MRDIGYGLLLDCRPKNERNMRQGVELREEELNSSKTRNEWEEGGGNRNGNHQGTRGKQTQRVINRVNSYYVLMYRMKLSKTKDCNGMDWWAQDLEFCRVCWQLQKRKDIIHGTKPHLFLLFFDIIVLMYLIFFLFSKRALRRLRRLLVITIVFFSIIPHFKGVRWQL